MLRLYQRYAAIHMRTWERQQEHLPRILSSPHIFVPPLSMIPQGRRDSPQLSKETACLPNRVSGLAVSRSAVERQRHVPKSTSLPSMKPVARCAASLGFPYSSLAQHCRRRQLYERHHIGWSSSQRPATSQSASSWDRPTHHTESPSPMRQKPIYTSNAAFAMLLFLYMIDMGVATCATVDHCSCCTAAGACSTTVIR